MLDHRGLFDRRAGWVSGIGSNRPPVHGGTEGGTPFQPLLGWTLDTSDGSLYVLDASYTVWQLAPETLAPLRASEPLVSVTGSAPSLMGFGRRGWPTSLVELALWNDQLLVYGGALPWTLVLSRDTLAVTGAIDPSGPLAAGPDGRLFVIGDAPEAEGSVKKSLVVYDLNAPDVAAREIMTSTMWGGPAGVELSAETGQLYVQMYSTPGTAPRDSTSIAILDTGTLTRTGFIADSYMPFYFLSRPAIAPGGNRVFTTARSNNSAVPPYLMVHTLGGEFLSDAKNLDGLPVIDTSGEWLYLLRDHGLWVLRGGDLSLRGILPFTVTRPAGLLLSPDGEMLYLLGNGWLSALPTGRLQTLGAPSISPLPEAWEDPARYAPSGPGTAGLQFTQFGHEIYRSEDGGRTWTFMPAFAYPGGVEVQSLSISPDYLTDGRTGPRPPFVYGPPCAAQSLPQSKHPPPIRS